MAQPPNQKERGGYQLFKGCEEKANAIKNKDANVKNVLTRRTDPGTDISARLDSNGLIRFKDNTIKAPDLPNSKVGLKAVEYSLKHSELLMSVHGEGDQAAKFGKLNKRKMELAIARSNGENVAKDDEDDAQIKAIKKEIEVLKKQGG